MSAFGVRRCWRYELNYSTRNVECMLPMSYKINYNQLMSTGRTHPKQARDKDNSSLVTIVLASSTAVLFVTLLIFSVLFIFWRRKQRKGDLLSYLHVHKMLGKICSSVIGPQKAKQF